MPVPRSPTLVPLCVILLLCPVVCHPLVCHPLVVSSCPTRPKVTNFINVSDTDDATAVRPRPPPAVAACVEGGGVQLLERLIRRWAQPAYGLAIMQTDTDNVCFGPLSPRPSPGARGARVKSGFQPARHAGRFLTRTAALRRSCTGGPPSPPPCSRPGCGRCGTRRATHTHTHTRTCHTCQTCSASGTGLSKGAHTQQTRPSAPLRPCVAAGAHAPAGGERGRLRAACIICAEHHLC
jgi:hypothetical protein